MAGEGESTELIEASQIEQRLLKYREIMGRETSEMTRAVRTAQAMGIAKAYVRKNIEHLKDLQGSELGFLTDKREGELYTEQELIDG